MFARRHERELAEIKALTYELRQRLEEILEELRRIEEKTEGRAQPPDWSAPAEQEADRTPTSDGTGAKPGSGKVREAGKARGAKVRSGAKARRREAKRRQGAAAPSVGTDEE
jgi:hypothetical protein